MTETLTPREKLVAQLIHDGRLNESIALVLGVSRRTVEVHRDRLMEKFATSDDAEFVERLREFIEAEDPFKLAYETLLVRLQHQMNRLEKRLATLEFESLHSANSAEPEAPESSQSPPAGPNHHEP